MLDLYQSASNGRLNFFHIINIKQKNIMPKKVIILIDGQNLYYNLHEMGILEKDVDWTKLFKGFIEEGEELIRTYWFRPAKILDTFFNEENITNSIVYKKFRTHFEHYKSKDVSSVPLAVQEKVNAEKTDITNWIKQQKDKFSTLEYAYDQLCLIHNDIEIIKTGVVKIDPYKKTYLGEKGVDISLAVKMISLSVNQKCDKIILVSGDYDYSEAVKFVKDNMTKISVVKFHKGFPPRSRSMSRDLSILADKVIDVYESDIKGTYKM